MIRFVSIAIMALAGLAACSPGNDPDREPTPPPQVEEDPAAYRGAAIAGQVCAQCHDVGIGAAPAQSVGAPGFREIAGRPASTAEGLAAWMRDSHPKMPNYIFRDQEVTDLAAYITSLAPDRAK